MRTLSLASLLVWGLVACGDSTIYAPGFSEDAFSEIRVGMTTEAVRRLIGDPLETRTVVPGEVWLYQGGVDQAAPGILESSISDAPLVTFNGERRVVAASRAPGVEIGMSWQQVEQLLGPAPTTFRHHDARRLYFAMPGGSGTYRARVVGTDSEGTVTAVYSFTSSE